MKMVKSLLLGSAAGLVAVAGAQAADLPVKAKPVEYVKICSIYGAGFFYIPGTDTCIKIGGWVRAEYAFRETGNSHVQFNIGRRRPQQPHQLERLRACALVRSSSLDVRTQTEYGTVRAYNRVGFQTTTAKPRRPCSTPSARSSRSPASPSARRSPTSTSSAVRSATAAATAATARRPVLAARWSPPTRRRSATASRPRSRWKTASCAAARSGMPATTRPTRS